MKKGPPHLIIALIFIQSFYVQAQNLVPNPSFEDTIACPVGISQMYAMQWHVPTQSSPDYFNVCNNSVVGVPQNYFGFQNPKSGVAFAGVYTAGVKLYAQYREYIQAQLLDTLIAGFKYYVSFYVSLADASQYSSNNIGAYLSSTPVSALSSPKNLPYIPQVNNTASNLLTDSAGWTLVADTITAIGNELYITIGNFNDTGSTQITFIGNGHLKYEAYYYVDDVSVERFSGWDGINENNNTPEFEVYPNPGNGMFNIKWLVSMPDVSTFEVVNVLGEIVRCGQLDRSTKTEIDLRDQTNGVYFLRIKNGSNVVSQNIVIQK